MKLKLKMEDFDKKSLLKQAVMLGATVRKYQSEGSLKSLAPATLYGMLNFVRLAKGLNLPLPQVARLTLLGNASSEDNKDVSAVLNEVFGIRDTPDGDDATMAGDLF